jgi:hypothetical protein
MPCKYREAVHNLMKVKLTKDTRVMMQAGSVVDVSEPVYNNLVSLGLAVPAGDETGTKKRRATKTK